MAEVSRGLCVTLANSYAIEVERSESYRDTCPLSRDWTRIRQMIRSTTTYAGQWYLPRSAQNAFQSPKSRLGLSQAVFQGLVQQALVLFRHESLKVREKFPISNGVAVLASERTCRHICRGHASAHHRWRMHRHGQARHDVKLCSLACS